MNMPLNMNIIGNDEWQAILDLLGVSFISILVYVPVLRLLEIFCGYSQEG